MLDTFFKKYAWTANLALLFAAAWLSARTVNTLAASLIRPKPSVDLASLPAAPPRPAGPPQLDPARLYALVGLKPPAAPVEEQQAGRPQSAQNCWASDAAPVKSGLHAQLVAAVLATPPRDSMATIIDLGTREAHVYGVGDAVMGTSLLSVERLRDDRGDGSTVKVAAIVCNDGRKEYLDFEPGAGASPPAAGAVAHVPDDGNGAAGGAPADGVKKVSDNRYDVKKSYIDNTLTNLNAVATQARLVPSFKNGAANGFKLFSIQPGSLYSAIGIENGDVIQRINGYEINSPDKALEIYQKLRESTHITIEIDRNGQIVRKEYNVTGS